MLKEEEILQVAKEKKAFAQWATMSWNENGKLTTVPIQELY